MKIGICCNVFGPSGGMERYTLDITKGLIEKGYQLEIFTKKVDKATANEFGIPVHHCNLKLIPGKLRDYFFSRWLQKSRTEFGITTMIGCCRNTASDIAMCGGTHVGFLKAIGRTPTLFDKLAIGIEREFYSRAKMVIAHSRLMSHELQEFYQVNSEKISVLYPPSSLDRFSPCTPDEKIRLRNQFDLPLDKKVFLFVSSSHERKGFPLLRKFFETTSLPVILAVAGRPIPCGLKNIRYLGFRNDIENLYRACDFSILASLYEPFGLAAVESVLCGTPVVLSKNIASSEIIPDFTKFSFTKNDLGSLTAAIGQALKKVPDKAINTYNLSSLLSLDRHIKTLESFF